MDKPKFFDLDYKARQDVIVSLMDSSRPKGEFYLLLSLSIVIVATGLLMNNAPAIIGGMVVAPLLSPILSLAMGVVLADFHIIRRSVQTILYALLLTVGFSLLISLFYADKQMNGEILGRSYASLGHLTIAIASGVAAAFALALPNISNTITGIAVSVSLLPPLAVAGIGIGFADWRIIAGSLVLFIINLVGIVISATIVFSLYGFYPLRNKAEKELSKEEEQPISPPPKPQA